MKNLILTTGFGMLMCYVSNINAANHNLNMEKQQLFKDWKLLISLTNKNQQGTGTTFVTVGFESQCNFYTGTTKIQDAIDSGADEVRIVSNGEFQEKLLIDNQSISIRGGYETCTDAINDIQTGQNTDLNGNLNNTYSGIRISGATNNSQVYLEKLNIYGNQSNSSGGGLNVTASEVDLVLNHVNIFSNYSDGQAGGILFVPITGSLSLYNSYVTYNEGFYGGGMECANNVTVSFYENSGLSFNQATKGGGAYVNNGCSFNMYSGSANTLSLSGIAHNQAKEEGGGLFVDSNATVNLNGNPVCIQAGVCIGDDINPVNVNNNKSDSDRDSIGDDFGGGIYMNGGATVESLSQARLSGVLFKDNLSGGSGGAIYAEGNFAELIIEQNINNCWNVGKCNLFQGNMTRLSDAFNSEGGAIYARGVEMDISHTYFEDNRSSRGNVLYLVYGNARLESNVFTRNGNYGASDFNDQSVIHFGLQSNANLIHNTFVDNQITSTVIGGFAAGNIEIKASIIYERFPYDQTTDTIFITSAVSQNINCLVVSKALAIGNNIKVADPLFVDVDNKDFHLQDLSPAIDFCENFFPHHKDMDQESHGWNNPNVPNQGGLTFNSYDAGADEFRNDEEIFQNGFE